VRLLGLGFLDGPRGEVLPERPPSAAKTGSTFEAGSINCRGGIWGELLLLLMLFEGVHSSTGTDNFRFGGADISNILLAPLI
jgi:hypothetical protein